MKYLAIGGTILFLFTSFTGKYGTREGTLICKSESGRSLFNAKLEDGTGLESAEFIIDAAKNSFTYKDEVNAIFDPANQVYTICINEKTENWCQRMGNSLYHTKFTHSRRKYLVESQEQDLITIRRLLNLIVHWKLNSLFRLFHEGPVEAPGPGNHFRYRPAQYRTVVLRKLE